MVIRFTEKIHYIGNENPIKTFGYLRELPDACPVCSFGVSPEYILMHTKNNYISELLCGCPRVECGALFFAVYTGKYGKNDKYIKRCYPYSKVRKEFPEEISELTPEFVTIYSQAHHAEQEGLDLICGAG